MVVEEQEMRYVLVDENNYRGARGQLLADQTGLQGADLLVAQRGRVSAFSLDASHACRGCYAEGTAVPDALVAEVLTRRIRSLKDGTVKAPPEAPPPHNERSRRAA